MRPRPNPQAFQHKGFLKIDQAIYPCRVSDMTTTGAHVILDHLMDLPDTFTVQLTLAGQVVRPCYLIWQEGHKAVVSFAPLNHHQNEPRLVSR